MYLTHFFNGLDFLLAPPICTLRVWLSTPVFPLRSHYSQFRSGIPHTYSSLALISNILGLRECGIRAYHLTPHAPDVFLPTSAVMHRHIPIFSAYPMCLSVTTTQQAAAGEVHPDDNATASSITPIQDHEVVFLLASCEL